MPHDPESVAVALFRAGRTLLALRVDRCWPAGLRSTLPVEVISACAAARDPLVAAPSAAEISAMDQALSWLGLLGPLEDGRAGVLRRLVCARMLVDPRTDRRRFSDRAIAAQFGIHHATVKTWWLEACAAIARALSRPGFCVAIKGADLRPVVRSWKAVGAAAASIERELA